MDNNDKNGTFNYTYSAQQQDEVKRIREKYIPCEENKMDRLRKLDQSSKKYSTATSLSVGIISSLLFGTGMACIMEWSENLFVVGLVVGIIGIVGMVLAYPINKVMAKKRREKLAPQIIELSDELMK